MWPPREQHSEPVPLPVGSPFVYGDGFNPALRASNASRRAREGCNPYTAPWETAVDEDGNALEDGSDDTSSSPEYYLSDYDDEDEPLAYTSARVRRGSEGWEVRPAGVGGASGGWNAGVSQLDAFAQAHAEAQQPWQRPGRYNVYSESEV
jgi:palmitoyltransferase